MALIYGCFCAISFILFRHQLPKIFNDNPLVLQTAGLLLLFAAIFQISDSTQAVGSGLLRGIKDVKVPTLLVAIAYWIIGIPAGYILAFHFKLGAAGIWMGLITGLTFASVLLITRFIKMTKKHTITSVE